MANPIIAPFTSEIWHLSVDDLLEPMSAAPRLGGRGPFVINLSASSAPMSQPAKAFIPPAGTLVYQIQRIEDRRPRYRLRVGPFLTEDQADAMLAVVREVYPGALTATAESDDLRAIASLQPKVESAPAPELPAPELTRPAAQAQPPHPAAATQRVAPRAQPVPPTVAIPVLSDSVESARRAAPPIGTPATHASAPAAAGAATQPGPAAPALPNARAPGIESTQTLRALSASELQDSAARWYVIQLSVSGQSFDPDHLPNLDIFNEYRLYSVAGLDQGRIVHALRLGFFVEEGAAAAVASYLAGFYEKPMVKRVSVAERERFRDQRVEARKDIGATGSHAVIEITGERHIREKRPPMATVTPLAPAAAHAQSRMTPPRSGK